MTPSVEDILDGNVREVKDAVREAEDPDYERLLEQEKEGKDRKTVKKFLRPRIEEKEDGDETGNEDDTGKEDEGDGSEEKDESNADEKSGKEKKLEEQLEDLNEIQGIEGAAVVRRDGLLIAVKMDRDIQEDQVGAMTASTVGSGETASEALKMGDVNEVEVEAEGGKLVSTGAGENGILTVLTQADVNMGLVKVEMGSAVEKIRRVL